MPLVEMMPKLTRMCKCFDLGGNHLSSTSVELLKEAMTKQFADVRPTWLAIGDDACGNTHLHDPLQCNPHCRTGCFHTQRYVVHVVTSLASVRQRHTPVKQNVDMKIECSKEWPKLLSEETTTPPEESSTDSEDVPTPLQMGLDVGATFRKYVQAQHSAVKLELLQSWAPFGDFIIAPLMAAARIARSQADSALEILHGSLGERLTTVIVDNSLYILAETPERRLTFIDVPASVHTDRLTDFNGCDATDAILLQDFTYIVEAEAHEAGQYELSTVSGQRLRTSLQITDYLLSGWVISDSLWFPIHKCKTI